MTTSTGSRKKQPATDLLTSSSGQIFTESVGTLKVKPQGQSRMSLGLFSDSQPPKGFLVEIYSDADESVTTQIIPVGSEKRYELVLHVANYGNKTINAGVWRL